MMPIMKWGIDDRAAVTAKDPCTGSQHRNMAALFRRWYTNGYPKLKKTENSAIRNNTLQHFG